MGKSIMIGSEDEQRAVSSKRSYISRRIAHLSPLNAGRFINANGFTLLELMIVMSIIVILVAIVLPMYQRTTISARETTLKSDLVQMRKLLDQYAADKGKLPQSLDDLVSGGYLREVPEDPITGERDWNVESGEDPNLPRGGSGIINVHSSSAETSTEGTPYNEW